MMIVCTHYYYVDPEGSPGDSVPHHLLVSGWAVLQPEECGGRDRGGSKGSEEDWQQAYAGTLQVYLHS